MSNTQFPTQYTYNQLADIFQAFALSNTSGHSQIKTVYIGSPEHLPSNIVYPLLMVNIPKATFAPAELKYQCSVLVLDRI